MTDLHKIRAAQVRAAEQAAIADLPPELLASAAPAVQAPEGGELPPLPPVTWPRNVGVPSWTAEEVQAYARAAIRAAQRQAERDNASFERGYQHGRQQERQILAAQPVATLPAQEAPAAVPMCSEQAVLHALTMARSETHQQGDAALWQAFGRAMWRQFNAMAAAAQAPAEGDAVPDLYERLAEAHDASLDDDHRACRSILTECMSLLVRRPDVQPKVTLTDEQIDELWSQHGGGAFLTYVEHNRRRFAQIEDVKLRQLIRAVATAQAPAPAQPAWVWNPARTSWEAVHVPGHYQEGALYAFGPLPEPLAPSPAVGAEVAALLPGTYYMDPPDGGNATVLEQLQRMAKDAARYRWVRDNATVGTVHLQTSDGWAHYGSGADDVVDAAMDAFNVPVQPTGERP